MEMLDRLRSRERISRRILLSLVSVFLPFLPHFSSFLDFVCTSYYDTGLIIDALLSADIALAPLVEDWVENYQNTTNDEVSERAAVHELILFVIRACGLAADVTEDEAMDVDGVPEAVDTIQEESVRVSYFLRFVDKADG